MDERAPSLPRRAALLATVALLGLCALAARALPGEPASVRPLPPDEVARGPGLSGSSDPAAPVAAQAGSAQPAEGAARRPSLLVLGDSILFGGFGQSLDAKLRERGEVWLYGSCGASSMSFLRGVRSECGSVRFEPGRPRERINGPAPTPRVDQLLATVKPDAALLVLGTNFLCCAAEAAPDVRALVDRLVAAKVPCLWVGVPSYRTPPSRTLTRHYAMLEEAIGDRCSVLDARTLGIQFRDVGDRVHVEPQSGEQWADAVVGVTFDRLLPGAGQPSSAPRASSK